jgi:hypothetical protein
VDTFYTAFQWPKSEAEIEGFAKPFKKDFRATSEGMVRSMFTPNADPEVINWVLGELSTADPKMGTNAIYSIFRWNAKNNPSMLKRYGKKLRNINGAPTGKETALDEGVVLIPNVGHFPAQVTPAAFNRALESIISDFSTP